jgi:hypothetical protein
MILAVHTAVVTRSSFDFKHVIISPFLCIQQRTIYYWKMAASGIQRRVGYSLKNNDVSEAHTAPSSRRSVYFNETIRQKAIIFIPAAMTT